MNPPYPPNPGYPNQPGYPPQQKEGMGCFAKGCITIIIILMLLGIVVGGAGWYIANNVRQFVSPTPVAVRTFHATDAQYQDVIGRYTEFVRALNAGHAATFTLSADDLNTLVARDPEFRSSRGKLYMDIKDGEIIAEAAVPIPRDGQHTESGVSGYFNGRIYFAASFSGGEFTMRVRRVESIDGKPMSDLFLRFFNSFDLGKIFNESMRDERRKGSAWAEAMTKVEKVVVDKDHIVATAVEGKPSSNPIPLPSEKGDEVASPSPSD